MRERKRWNEAVRHTTKRQTLERERQNEAGWHTQTDT